MAVPTVFLVGTERLPLIPEYLNLGSVVVVAPDPGTLKRWRARARGRVARIRKRTCHITIRLAQPGDSPIPEPRGSVVIEPPAPGPEAPEEQLEPKRKSRPKPESETVETAEEAAGAEEKAKPRRARAAEPKAKAEEKPKPRRARAAKPKSEDAPRRSPRRTKKGDDS